MGGLFEGAENTEILEKNRRTAMSTKTEQENGQNGFQDWLDYTNKKTEGQTTKKEETTFDSEKTGQYINEGLKDFEAEYEPIKRNQTEYLNGLQEIYKRFDPTGVPAKEKDRRLSGLLMLSDAITHLGGVTGEMLGEQYLGGHSGLGLIPERKNKNFETAYKNYLAKADAVKQQKALEGQKALERAVADLKGRVNIANDYARERLAEKNRLKKRAEELYKTTTTTTDGYDKVKTDPNSQEYKNNQALLRARINSYNKRAGSGSRSGKKKENEYELYSWSYRQNRFAKDGNNTAGLPHRNSEIEQALWSNESVAIDEKQINRMYTILGEDIKDFFTENDGKWTRAKSTKDKLDQINALSQYVSDNEGENVGKYWLSLMRAGNEVFYGKRNTYRSL